MKKLIVNIRPFSTSQHLFIFDDGVKLNQSTVTMPELQDSILQLSREYGVTEIDITGARRYNTKIAEDIKKQEMLRYGKDNLNINII